ncbi:MAG: Na+/H+ antiporter [Sphingobacteriia bacterium]|nr:Na+/H+ antiporter [Sphingobacteriia bacterium]
MSIIETIIILLICVVALSVIAAKINVLFPVLLTIVGLLLGAIPSFPKIFLDPSIVMLVFLPPILYIAAFNTNWYEFKQNRKPIAILAFTMVFVTTLGIGFIAKTLLPGFTLATGFLLGAIISPPDAVAATAVFKKMVIPKKIISILEGESLVNDASALIAFQFALVAVTTGHFSLTDAAGKFIWVVFAGIFTGLTIAAIAVYVRKRWQMDPAIETGVTFITAYAAYLAAEQLHCSAVLSVVAAGLYVGSKEQTFHKASTRLQATAVWNFVVILLEGVIFILIGLQIPYIIAGIKGEPLWHLMLEGFLIALAAILIRFVFVFAIHFIADKLRVAMKLDPLFPSFKYSSVIAYSGMRGVVSLAAAFSIPLVMDNGMEFPHRNLILFIVFSVIVITLVAQGLTLPWFIKKINIDGGAPAEQPSSDILQLLAKAALNRVEEIIHNENLESNAAGEIRDMYYTRVLEFNTIKSRDQLLEKQLSKRLMLEAVRAKRKKLFQLQYQRMIDQKLFKELEHDLDLEETRLQKLKIIQIPKR